jgi:hypothetical protein
MGIICRWQGEADFIAGVLRGDGMVSLWRKSAGEVERWVDWTPLADGSLDLSATHSLQLTCQSDGIRFTVDGVEAATAQDPSPSTGTIALLAGLLEEGQATVAFDDMVVSRPGESSIGSCPLSVVSPQLSVIRYQLSVTTPSGAWHCTDN